MPRAPTWAPRPFRTGGVPQCGHECCLSASRGVKHSLFSAKQAASPASPVHPSASPLWKGPSGVTTVFYRIIRNASSAAAPPANDSAAAWAPAAPQPQAPPSSNPKDAQLLFLLGFDKGRSKNSICSGTLSDSWHIDAGCGVWGAIRECAEEFKIHFRDDADFLAHVSFYWWEAATLCFAIDLDSFNASPEDAHRVATATIRAQMRADMNNPSLPPCCREIVGMKELLVPLTANAVRGKFYETQHAMTGFAMMCCSVVLTTMKQLLLPHTQQRPAARIPDDAGSAPAAVAVEAAVEKQSAAAPAAAVAVAAAPPPSEDEIKK